MDELIGSLRRFIARDVIFIVGGSAVVLSFCYAFDHLWILDMPRPLYFVAAGFAYVVGYVVQDLACLSGLVTTAHFFKPGGTLKRIYRVYTRHDWTEIAPFDGEAAWLRLERAAAKGEVPEASFVRLERVVALRQVGTTLGPCCLLSSVFLLYRGFKFLDPFDMALAVGVLVLGLVLIALAWLKGAQQVELTQRLGV